MQHVGFIILNLNVGAQAHVAQKSKSTRNNNLRLKHLSERTSTHTVQFFGLKKTAKYDSQETKVKGTFLCLLCFVDVTNFLLIFANLSQRSLE